MEKEKWLAKHTIHCILFCLLLVFEYIQTKTNMIQLLAKQLNTNKSI